MTGGYELGAVDSPVDWAAYGLTRHEPRRMLANAPRTIPEIVSMGAAAWPDREALVGRFGRYTYSAFAEAVDCAVCALQALGLQRGDRIAATSANHTDIVIAFFAAQRLGAVWVGVNRNLAGPEKRFMLEDSGSSLYLADRDSAAQVAEAGKLENLRAVVDMEPGDPASEWAQRLYAHAGARPDAKPVDPYAPAAIAYTSGTTGFPKGAVHSQHNLVVVGAMGRAHGLSMGLERAGVTLPVTILNLMTLGPITAFMAGRTSVMMDRIDAVGVAEWVKAEKVETFAAAPTMVYDLLSNPAVKPEDLDSLKAPGAGGAAVPEALRDLYRARFGRELTSSYGMTEAPTSVTFVDPTEPLIAASCGKACMHLRLAIQDADGREMPVGESGEICVAGATEGEFAGLYTPMLGYWRRPEATEEALRGGWYHTGDMGRLDAAGNLYVEGRRNDVILRGGANVYPAEIERVLHMDARVNACAVVGKPDERLGELVVAFVQAAPQAGSLEVLEADLRALCQRELARYKVPAAWIFTDEMPRNAMNKVVKAELKRRFFTEV